MTQDEIDDIVHQDITVREAELRYPELNAAVVFAGDDDELSRYLPMLTNNPPHGGKVPHATATGPVTGGVQHIG